jgi:hypothetical protein
VTFEHDRWAVALLIEHQHGGEAPLIIADRIKERALAGDEDGVLQWLEVATRFDQLRADEGQRH